MPRLLTNSFIWTNCLWWKWAESVFINRDICKGNISFCYALLNTYLCIVNSVNNFGHRFIWTHFSVSFKHCHFTSIWDCKQLYASNIIFALISRIACQWIPASPEAGVTAAMHSIYSFAKFLRILFIRSNSQHKQFCSGSPGWSWRKKVVRRKMVKMRGTNKEKRGKEET